MTAETPATKRQAVRHWPSGQDQWDAFAADIAAARLADRKAEAMSQEWNQPPEEPMTPEEEETLF